MVASYSELYEEGEAEHINGVWPVFLLKTAKISSNYIMTFTSGGVASLRVAIKVQQFLATSAFGLAPTACSHSSPVAYQQPYPTHIFLPSQQECPCTSSTHREGGRDR